MAAFIAGVLIALNIFGLIVGFGFSRSGGLLGGIGWFMIICCGFGLLATIAGGALDEKNKEEARQKAALKQCPHCAEDIKIEARKCKHCGEAVA